MMAGIKGYLAYISLLNRKTSCFAQFKKRWHCRETFVGKIKVEMIRQNITLHILYCHWHRVSVHDKEFEAFCI